MALVLHVTSAWDTTTDLVLDQLDRLGIQSARINTEAFPVDASLSLSLEPDLGGVLSTDSGRTVSLSDIRSIYYRRPEPSDFGGFPAMSEESKRFAAAESFAGLRGMLSLASAGWVNHPDITRLAEVKPDQLRTARNVGFSIPRSLITNDPDTARSFVSSLDNRAIVKTLKSPRISRSSGRLAYSHLLEEDELDLLDSLVLAPCIIQEYIEKRVECRVVVVGQRVFSVDIHSQDHVDSRIDWRRADYTSVPHHVSTLPAAIEQACLRFARKYRLRFATLDLIQRPDRSYVFLECNPNGEWAWLEGTTGVPIAREVAQLLASDVSRGDT